MARPMQRFPGLWSVVPVHLGRRCAGPGTHWATHHPTWPRSTLPQAMSFLPPWGVTASRDHDAFPWLPDATKFPAHLP